MQADDPEFAAYLTFAATDARDRRRRAAPARRRRADVRLLAAGLTIAICNVGDMLTALSDRSPPGATSPQR